MIHVVAAAVIDPAGRILIAQRPAGKPLAGGWEFPGGKVEPGETRIAALARELREELGIDIRAPRPLLRLRHVYDHGDVLLDVWVVSRYRGEPTGLDGQAIHWCESEALDRAPLLPADRPIVRALRLPERLVRDGCPDYRIDAFVSGGGGGPLRGVWCADAPAALAAAAGGAEFLVLRNVVPDAELEALCAAVPVPVYARLDDLEHAWGLGVCGLNQFSALTPAGTWVD